MYIIEVSQVGADTAAVTWGRIKGSGRFFTREEADCFILGYCAGMFGDRAERAASFRSHCRIVEEN